MNHFIAYHNTDRMGYELPSGSPTGAVLTNKSFKDLRGSAVWIITYQGKGFPRRYCLGTVFTVMQVRDGTIEGFKFKASGPGHSFMPMPAVAHLAWFPSARPATSNFSFGLCPIHDPLVIKGLVKLASEAGLTL